MKFEVLEGVVQQINDGGFKLVERWLNYGDRWTGRQVRPGDRIKVRIRGRYLVHMAGEGEELPPEPQPRAGGRGPQRSPEEERREIRQSVIHAAVDFLRDRPEVSQLPIDERAKAAHVLKLADTFEAWVYR
jgi:hypothetical protein